MTIYPSILQSDAEIAERQARLILEVGGPLQWDVVDGQFADNHTLEPQDLDRSFFADRSVDVHLMVVDPSQWLGAYAGLPFVRGVVAQVERLPDPEEFLAVAHEYGFLAGFSFDVHTPLEEFPPEILQRADVLQLMGVQAGHQGQVFQSGVLQKLRAVQAMAILNPKAELLVDGGVKLEMLPDLAQSGATGVVVGSAIWGSDNPRSTLEHFRLSASE